MIKIELDIEDINYDLLLEQYLPVLGDRLRESGNPLAMLLSNGMPGSLARTVLEKAPKSAKDKLCADLLNGSAAKLIPELERFAAEKGAEIKIGSLRATTK